MQVYYDKDADLNIIKNKKIAVIGFGSQGHAHAMNLADSGCDVSRRTEEHQRVRRKGAECGTASNAGSPGRGRSDIIMILTPDELTPGIYDTEIAPAMRAGKYLALAHGFSIHFGFIKPPKDVNVFMVAPQGTGTSGAPSVSRRAREFPACWPFIRIPPATPRKSASPTPAPLAARAPE